MDCAQGKNLMSGGKKAARLLHVFGTFQPGGAETRTIRIMARLGKGFDHRVMLGNPSAADARPTAEALGNVCFADDLAGLAAGRPALARMRRLAAAMRGFDLVLSYGWGGMDAVAARRLFGKQLGLPPLIHHDDGFDVAEGMLRTGYRRLALPGAHRLVVPSVTLEQIAQSRWKMPLERIVRIGNGVDIAACTDAAGQLPFPGLEGEGRIVVGTVAGLRPVKNLPRLVRAVAAAGPGVVLAIAGEGPAREQIIAEAERCGIADRVLLPGFLADPWRYFGSFDLFALASDSEQFPISMAEAMAAGLPVVATDVGDIAAMVSELNRAFVIDLGDEPALARSITQLAGDNELRARIGAANAAKARQEFDERDMMSAFSALYHGAIGRQRG